MQDYGGYKPGFIYVLKSGQYYKIGYADNVDQRMKTVGTAVSPNLKEPITLLFSFPTQSKLIAERALHELWRAVRVKGEWFEFKDKAVEMLRRFADGYSVDEFVMHLHRLPDEIILFTDEDVQFCQDFNIKLGEIDPGDLAKAIRIERMKRSRSQRGKRYQKLLSGLLNSMSIDDLEWMYETVMKRGITSEADVIDLPVDDTEFSA